MPASLRRLPRMLACALIVLAVLCGAAGAASASHVAGAAGVAAGSAAGRAGRAVPARTLAAAVPAASGPCSVPGIGDIGGLLGFCTLGQAGLTGALNNICQPSVPTPEPANSGVDALIRPPRGAGSRLATPYGRYGIAGANWEATKLQCSDMSSLIGNDVAGMIFDVAKAVDRMTITVYQAAAGEGILSWLKNAADRLIGSLGRAIYFPYLALIVIIGAIWLAWQGLVRKRGSRTIEGTIWMVLACAAAIWLIGRPADFTGVGRGVSDGITAALNAGFAHLPTPGQASCLRIGSADPQIQPASYAYSSAGTVVDQNANELWTVLVCKPWLDGEFGTTALAQAGGRPTPVDTYGRQLLWAQAIAVNERPTPALIAAKQAAYTGIATSIQQHDPAAFPLFQGKQWTTRLEIGIAALLAALIAGVLVLLVSVTLILLKLGFLLLLVVGPFFLLIGTHPGFGRVVAVRWFEMLVGVLLKQAAVALALSVLLYCYALIMGTSDAVLPWVLKILMITLVTVAVFIYRKPFAHLFSAVGYGVIGSADRADAELSRAARAGAANTSAAAMAAVPGYAAYRLARWTRRNPAQAAGLAMSAVTAAGAAATAARAATAAHPGTAETAAADAGAAASESGGRGQLVAGHAAGVAAADGLSADEAVAAGAPGSRAPVTARARARAASAGIASARDAPPLSLPARQAARGSAGQPGRAAAVSGAGAAGPAGPGAAAAGGGQPAVNGSGAGSRWPTAGGLSSESLARHAPPLAAAGSPVPPAASAPPPASGTAPAAEPRPARWSPAGAARGQRRSPAANPGAGPSRAAARARAGAPPAAAASSWLGGSAGHPDADPAPGRPGPAGSGGRQDRAASGSSGARGGPADGARSWLAGPPGRAARAPRPAPAAIRDAGRAGGPSQRSWFAGEPGLQPAARRDGAPGLGWPGSPAGRPAEPSRPGQGQAPRPATAPPPAGRAGAPDETAPSAPGVLLSGPPDEGGPAERIPFWLRPVWRRK